MARKVTTGSLYRRTYRDAQGGRKTAAVWWMKFYIPRNPNPIRESTGCEKWADAQQVLKRRVGEIAGTGASLRSQTCTIADLLEMVLADYEKHNRSTYLDLKSKLNKRLKPAFGGIKANALSTQHIAQYQNSRRKVGAKNGSINRELAVLKRALSLGEKHTPKLVLSPLTWEKLTENNVREGILAAERYEALRDALPDYVRLPFVIAYHCGCRKGELLAIPRERVDLAAGKIYLEAMTTKNKTPRFLPIYGEMRAYLEMQLAELDANYPGCRWLMHRQGDRLYDFEKSWRAATRVAGVEGLLFHDLRRTALTNMENAGIPRRVATSISGHKTEAVYRRYVIRRADAIEKAGEQMEAYLNSARKAVNGHSIGHSGKVN
jgi:integrase